MIIHFHSCIKTLSPQLPYHFLIKLLSKPRTDQKCQTYYIWILLWWWFKQVMSHWAEGWLLLRLGRRKAKRNEVSGFSRSEGDMTLTFVAAVWRFWSRQPAGRRENNHSPTAESFIQKKKPRNTSWTSGELIWISQHEEQANKTPQSQDFSSHTNTSVYCQTHTHQSKQRSITQVWLIQTETKVSFSIKFTLKAQEKEWKKLKANISMLTGSYWYKFTIITDLV